MNKKQVHKRLTLRILPKLILSFLVISCVPLLILGYIMDENLKRMGLKAVLKTEGMGIINLESAKKIGKKAIEDSVRMLDQKSTEAIELRTVELAQRIADFLYERDQDILILAALEPDPERYLHVYRSCNRDVILTGSQSMERTESLSSLNPENQKSWRNRHILSFEKTKKPLYKELTFIDLKGREKIKILYGKISGNLKDVSKIENTYCKAEDYFSHLNNLKNGEIYVSRVIGPYIKGWLFKTQEGIRVKPESAYAGKENPQGLKFDGIIRWVTPVFDARNHKIGYVTMALDHTHIMEFTDHVVPTEERFTVLSNGGSGNYAFLWDDQGQCISHARDFFICGYDSLTGKEVPGWISQSTYDEFKVSGLTLEVFVNTLPSFRNFSKDKRGSEEQLKSGCIPLDCRILDTAPQCQDWYKNTEDGGSGSFLIFWSGIWKLTTYAVVPYHTGIYGETKRGFGYVTIGANVKDFHKVADISKDNIEKSIRDQSEVITYTTSQTRKLIKTSAERNRSVMLLVTLISGVLVIGASILISLTITKPLKRLTAGVVAMSRGKLDQSIVVKSQDEIGELAKAFNEMAVVISEVDRIKSEFVTTASHELKTPIHAMLLGVSGVLDGYSGEISDSVRKDLGFAKEGIERLMRLVEDLLDISKIEAHKTKFTTAPISIAKIIDTALEEVSDWITFHHHIVVKSIPDNIPDIHINRNRMIQVIVNLLSNAIKYTKDEGKIIISVEKKDKKILISIVDNGYGIPVSVQKKVFEKFFQADNIMSQKVGGSGLGLAITKGIVEEHRGTISCESPVPNDRFPDLPLGGERKGTIFVVTLFTNE